MHRHSDTIFGPRGICVKYFWQMQDKIFGNVNILFTDRGRTSSQQTRIFRCGDIESILSNISIQSIYIKTSQSVFM